MGRRKKASKKKSLAAKVPFTELDTYSEKKVQYASKGDMKFSKHAPTTKTPPKSILKKTLRELTENVVKQTTGAFKAESNLDQKIDELLEPLNATPENLSFSNPATKLVKQAEIATASVPPYVDSDEELYNEARATEDPFWDDFDLIEIGCNNEIISKETTTDLVGNSFTTTEII